MRIIDKLADKVLMSIVARLDDQDRNNIIDPLADMVADKLKAKIDQTGFDKAVAMEVVRVLGSDEMKKALWMASNVRPNDVHWSFFRPHSISEKIYEKVASESAEFIMGHLKEATEKQNQLDNLSHAVSQVDVKEGLFLEFGVFEGVTINHIARLLPNKIVHGFDCFEGLPEDWTLGASAGSYSTQGKIPEVEANVKLHIGLFDDVLPEFKKYNTDPIALLHIDSDIYSSAKTALTLLENQIVPGTVIVFDEFLNYPGFKDHEYKAFFEYIALAGRSFKVLSYVDRGFSVAFKIL
jgi:hypothetical protein